MQTTLDFDRVFRALADATRRDIVRRAIAGEEGVAELAEHYPMSFAARSSAPMSRGSAARDACSTDTRSCGAGGSTG
jgi:DNA-binding transcriptional ArsR family regulator